MNVAPQFISLIAFYLFNYFTTYFRVMLPLSKTALLILFSFISWLVGTLKLNKQLLIQVVSSMRSI